MNIHSAALENGLNIVLGTGELQNIHTPRENLDTRKEVFILSGSLSSMQTSEN